MNMMRRGIPTPTTARVAGRAPATAARPGGSGPRAAVARPVSPSAKADDLFLVMRQLTELLIKENTALKKHRVDEVKALIERKESLARLYQGHMNNVHRDRSIIDALDSAKKNAVAQAAMKLSELMKENASLLKANIDSINMFFKAMTDALKSHHDEKSASYSRSGALGAYAVTKRSLAVSYNQTM